MWGGSSGGPQFKISASLVPICAEESKVAVFTLSSICADTSCLIEENNAEFPRVSVLVLTGRIVTELCKKSS